MIDNCKKVISGLGVCFFGFGGFLVFLFFVFFFSIADLDAVSGSHAEKYPY